MPSLLHLQKYEIPVIEHTPWQKPPIKVPQALEDVVRREVEEQKRAGRFESTTSSYRSSMWTVAKKDPNKVRLVLDLQDLNSVTIRDSSLPPNVEDFAEGFVGRAIYGSADLFSGFDARILAVKSRPMTAFHSPIGPLQQCTLPQGSCNAVQEFQKCVVHALSTEIRHFADPFVDDTGIKGPESNYNNEPIPSNPSIRRFVYEYATTLDRILARFIAAGITASGVKTILATSKLIIVGMQVSLQGWHLEKGLVSKILKWPTPKNTTEVRGFLGTVGCGRRWIQGFSLIAKPLTLLTKSLNMISSFRKLHRTLWMNESDLLLKRPF